jgi:hypothetical protein
MNRPVFFCVALLVLAGQAIAHAQVSQILVGPNVHVSRVHERYSIGEVLLSSDPVDANRLLGCAIIYSESENRRWTVVYLSTDGGNNWQPTLETKNYEDSADPACALGRAGLAIHVAIATNDREHSSLCVYRSSDGGKNWTKQEDIPMTFHGIDRESATIDRSEGKFGNWVYITGQSFINDSGGGMRNAFGVWRSRNGGMSFEGPTSRTAMLGRYLVEPSNGAVLSDGTLVSIFGDIKHYDFSVNRVPQATPEQSNADLEAVTTTEGGDSISEATRVDDFFMVSAPDDLSIVTSGMPTLAVDPGDGPFRDRLYATWADVRDGRSEIRLAYSADGGKTWSKSIVIDDISGPTESKSGPQNFLPTVAVNNAGVVAVTWYDRRLNPDGLGWFVRFRCSLDGGETWLPSVSISEKPNTFSPQQKLFTSAYAVPAGTSGLDAESEAGSVGLNTESVGHIGVNLQWRQFFAGDYAGLAADASGTFHALWIDDRTGLAQVWTTRIVVDGRAIRNGTAELSGLSDVSRDVKIDVVSTGYDRVLNTVTIGVRLKNSSKDVIQGPVKLRLVNITSALGTPSAANADNHLAGPGAVWDCSNLIESNMFRPNQMSNVKKLVFRLDHPRDLLDDTSVRTGLVDFDVRVLAGRNGAQ